MEILELEKGWLVKQVSATLMEFDTWPRWMKEECEIRARQVSTVEIEK